MFLKRYTKIGFLRNNEYTFFFQRKLKTKYMSQQHGARVHTHTLVSIAHLRCYNIVL